MIAPLTFHQCCQSVTLHCDNGHAITYASRGLRIVEPRAQRVQARYILNNLSQWRGEHAKRVRESLREFAKERSHEHRRS